MTRKEEDELYEEYEADMEANQLSYDSLSFNEWLRSKINRDQIGVSGLSEDY